jgi:hypothetical protein
MKGAVITHLAHLFPGKAIPLAAGLGSGSGGLGKKAKSKTVALDGAVRSDCTVRWWVDGCAIRL